MRAKQLVCEICKKHINNSQEYSAIFYVDSNGFIVNLKDEDGYYIVKETTVKEIEWEIRTCISKTGRIKYEISPSETGFNVHAAIFSESGAMITNWGSIGKNFSTMTQAKKYVAEHLHSITVTTTGDKMREMMEYGYIPYEAFMKSGMTEAVVDKKYAEFLVYKAGRKDDKV